MTRSLTAAALLVAMAAPCAAETQYDRRLEEAAMRIVAGRIGDIRGSLDLRVAPVAAAGWQETAPQPQPVGKPVVHPDMRSEMALGDGLSRAVERRVSRVVLF